MYPILFQAGDITFYTYGFTLMTALFLIYFLAVRNVHGSVLDRNDIDNIGLIVLVSLWLGGSMVYWTVKGTGNIESMFDFRSMHRLGTASVIASFGGMLLLYCLWKHRPFLKVLDYLVPFFVLGYGIQRTFGCFLSGDSYGIPTDLPWGVAFPDTGGIGPEPGVKVHPTQLYLGFAAFATWLMLDRAKAWKNRDGVITGLCMIGIFGSYFVVTFFRGDLSGESLLFGLEVSQLFSLTLFVAGHLLIIWAFFNDAVRNNNKPIMEIK